jgi:hypothetical protein
MGGGKGDHVQYPPTEKIRILYLKIIRLVFYGVKRWPQMKNLYNQVASLTKLEQKQEEGISSRWKSLPYGELCCTARGAYVSPVFRVSRTVNYETVSQYVQSKKQPLLTLMPHLRMMPAIRS